MQDKAHVAAAESYSRYASPAVKAKIAAKASKTFHKKKGRGKPFKALLK